MRTLTGAEAREAFAEIDGRNYSSVVLRNYFGTGRTVMQARVGHCGGTDYSDLGLVDDKTAKSLIALGATDWRRPEDFKRKAEMGGEGPHKEHCEVDETHRYLTGGDIAESVPMCAHCGGMVAIRNPRGDCDHLYWPDMLTDEAKIANGFRKVDRVVTEWVKG